MMPDLSYPFTEVLQPDVELRAESPRGSVALLTSARKPLWLLPAAQWDILRLLGDAVPTTMSPVKDKADPVAATLDTGSALHLRDDRQLIRLRPPARERLRVLLRAIRGPVTTPGSGRAVYVALYTQADQPPQVLAVRDTQLEAYTAAGACVGWARDSEWVDIGPEDPLTGVQAWCRPTTGGRVRVEEHWTGPSPRLTP